MAHTQLSGSALAHADNMLNALRHTDFQPGGRYGIGALLDEPENADAVARAVEAHIRAHLGVNAISAENIRVTAARDDHGFICMHMEVRVP